MTAPDFSALTSQNIVAFIGDIFAPRGAEEYLGEPVTIAEHMLQGATIAERNGQDEMIVAAVLLHDIGHFVSEFGSFQMDDTEDRYHEVAGAKVLARFFPALITACVRHHVTAKRYLCATKTGYAKRLSEASIHSLKLQGGPMNAAEIAAFEQNPYVKEIIQVRCLDDAGKRTDMTTLPFSHFAPMIQRIVDAHCGSCSANAPDFIFEASSKPSLPWHEVPLVRATDSSVEGFGRLVEDPENCDIEIVRWPAGGWRLVDDDSGDEGGWVEGIFTGRWTGDVLCGTNDAVNGDYILGWSTDPQQARADKATVARDQVLLWHMNYHPDGGQLFYPLDNKSFIVPVALPGDDLAPEKVIALWCDGSRGLYIHPNIWHEGIFPVADEQRFLDRQGRVHARVSCDMGKEFGVYLCCPLTPEKISDLKSP